MPAKLQSRKLWVALVGAVVQLLAVVIAPAQAEEIGKNLMVVVSAYLIGQGVADHGNGKKWPRGAPRAFYKLTRADPVHPQPTAATSIRGAGELTQCA